MREKKFCNTVFIAVADNDIGILPDFFDTIAHGNTDVGNSEHIDIIEIVTESHDSIGMEHFLDFQDTVCFSGI